MSRALREVRVGGMALTMVHVLHMYGDAEGLGQSDSVDVVLSLYKGFHFLLAELLDSLPTHCR